MSSAPTGSALAVGLVVLAVGAVALLGPYLTRERESLAATPQPAAVTGVALVDLPAGQRACLAPVVLDRRAEQARLRVGTFGAPSVPLRLTISGSGYSQSRHVPAATWIDNDTIVLAVDAPPRPLVTTVCVGNEGGRRVALYGAGKGASRAATRVDGRPLADVNFQLTFAERARHPLGGRLALLVERMAVFRPLPPWLLWPLAVLSLLAIAVGALAAFVLSLRDED